MATRSILLRMSSLRLPAPRRACRGSPRPPRPGPCARRSARRPDRRRARRSRRWSTMARSSRRLGAKMPGVSTKMSCDSPSIAMPRMSARVVCTLRETMVTLEPTSALSSVDLPALGAPISATKPQRVSPSGVRCQPSGLSTATPTCASMAAAAACSAARLELPMPSAGGRSGSVTATRNFGIVMRAGARQFLIGRRRQPARLRPFLQHGLGVAQRPQRLEHALVPEARHQFVRRLHSRRRGRWRRSAPRRRQPGWWCAGARRHSSPSSRA